MKLVSIIIPAFNAEKYITKTIESALHQDWPNKEIIIIDDGSTDNTLQIAREHELINKNIIVQTQSNKGASAARNRGLKIAKGDYIQFLDADDLISYNKISKQLDLARLSNYDPFEVYTCKTVRIVADIINGDVISDNPKVNFDFSNGTELLVNLLLQNSYISSNAYLISKEIAAQSGYWNESISTNDDSEFFARVLINAKQVKYCKTSIAYYRDTVMSLSKNRETKSLISQFNSLVLISEQLLEKNNEPICKDSVSSTFNWFIVEWFPANRFLLKRVESYMKTRDIKYKTSSQNKLYLFFIRILGWRRAYSLSFFISNVKDLFRIK